MSLRSRKTIEPHLDESIFGSRALPQPLPKYRFPAHENSAADIFQVVADKLYRVAPNTLSARLKTLESQGVIAAPLV